jgi:hypothetical protein
MLKFGPLGTVMASHLLPYVRRRPPAVISHARRNRGVCLLRVCMTNRTTKSARSGTCSWMELKAQAAGHIAQGEH